MADFVRCSCSRRTTEYKSPATISQPEAAQPEKSKSTGPRTGICAKRSASRTQRATVTTGCKNYQWRAVAEDMEAYHRFCEELLTDLAPGNAARAPIRPNLLRHAMAFEPHKFHQRCDAQFSLLRRSCAGNIDTEHPQVHAALTAARVFRDDSTGSPSSAAEDEQRLHRTL